MSPLVVERLIFVSSQTDADLILKLFLTPLLKHCPQHHKYHKFYNKNNVKIKNYNPNLLSKHLPPPHVAVCSSSYCKKSEYPLDNECLSESLILKAAAPQNPSLTSN